MPDYRQSLTIARSNFSFQSLTRPIRDDAPTNVFVEIPYDLLGVFIRRYETGGAVQHVPVYAVAAIGLATDDPEDVAEALLTCPLGLLATDHAGYASFDLATLRETGVHEKAIRLMQDRGLMPAANSTATLTLIRLLVIPFVDPRLAIDALAEGDGGVNVLALRIELDESDLLDREYQALQAMQNPSIADWRLSPGSFSISGALLVGADGCETLVPANLSTQTFRFRQATRSIRDPINLDSVRLRYGHALEYLSEWFGVGHSLGQVQYSLPLAPGEKVKIAIIDWSRQDRATRSEETDFKESLVHDWTRDRSLTETVSAVLNEWQRGGSVMGGVAGSGTAGAFGGSVALGGAYTTSSGTRELEAETTQRISDAFHQASSAMRELRSTVVVQSEQAEKATAKTRLVANYNHSHALTLLYYEVLRHYRVVTRLVSREPLFWVDYSKQAVSFTADDEKPDEVAKLYAQLLASRRILQPALLDPSLAAGFAALDKLTCARVNHKEVPSWQEADDFGLGEVILRVKSKASVPNRFVTANLVLKHGDPMRLLLTRYDLSPIPKPEEYYSTTLTPAGWGQDVWPNAETYFRLRPERHVRWGMIHELELGLTEGGATWSGAAQNWEIEHVHMATATEPFYWMMISAPPPRPELKLNESMRMRVTRYSPGPHTPEASLSDEERCAIARLRQHLVDHTGHYNRVLWREEDVNERALRFESIKVGPSSLLDWIDNRVVDVTGNQVGFRVAAGLDAEAIRLFEGREDPGPVGNDFVEQLLTMPSRGVFAEAKLGNCNASERIDTERFWDWQTSPIPDDAPAIEPVSTDSRQVTATGLTPSAFPTSMVNIVTPPTVPDPTGMTAGLGLFAAMGGFRDMSAAKEVGALLQTLSNNASGLAMQGLKGQQTKNLVDQIRNAKEIPPGKRADLISELLTGKVKQSQAQEQTQAQAQAQGQGQGQEQTQAQAQAQSQSGAQAQSQGQGQAQGQGQTQGQGQSQSQGQQVNVGPQTPTPRPKPAPKPQLTERLNPSKVTIVLLFKNFEDIGQIQNVWAALAESKSGAADGIPNGPPYAGQKRYECRHIESEGTMEVFVQMQPLTCHGGTKFVPKAPHNIATITVSPLTTVMEVEETEEYKAHGKATFTFQSQQSGELPLKVLTLKVVNTVGPTLEGGAEGTQSTKKKYTVLVVRKGLHFEGDV